MATLIKTIKERLTDDTIYPVTKATAVYLDDNVTTVEGSINKLRDDLDFHIIDNRAKPPHSNYSYAGNYYARMGIDKGSALTGTTPPYAYLDIRDSDRSIPYDPASTAWAGDFKNNLRLFDYAVEGTEQYFSAAAKEYMGAAVCNDFVTNIVSTAAPAPHLKYLSGRGNTTGLPKITTLAELDSLLRDGVVYYTEVGTSLKLPMDMAIIIQYSYSGVYHTQYAIGVNTQLPVFLMRSNTASGWGYWNPVVQSRLFAINGDNSVYNIAGSTVGIQPQRHSNLGEGGAMFVKGGYALVNFANTISAAAYASTVPLIVLPDWIHVQDQVRGTVWVGDEIKALTFHRKEEDYSQNNYNLSGHNTINFTQTTTLSSNTSIRGQMMIPYVYDY